jgi:hypothetical protein
MGQKMEAVRKAGKDSLKSQQGRAAADDVGSYTEIQKHGPAIGIPCLLTSSKADTNKGFIKFLSYVKEVFVSVTIPVIVGTFVYLTLNAIIHALLR